jgi:hypothetical protein
MDSGVPASTLVYAGVLEAAAAAGSALLEPVSRRIALGDVSLVVVPPPGIAAWDQYDNSIGLIVEFGAFRLSLAGDAEPREWAWWTTHHPEWLTPVHVHKASHHGSANGDTADAIARLSPEIVIVSAGQENAYGHPDPAALRLYADNGAQVYRTDVHGTVIVEAEPSGRYTVRVSSAAKGRNRLPQALYRLPQSVTVDSSPGAPTVDHGGYRPTWQGFGTTTYGGSGRHTPTNTAPTVYEVTNLNASGAGSLHACVIASGPRVCVFETSGIITQTTRLDLTNPYITIAGQTAPSPGITVNARCGWRVQTNDAVLQHLRIRRGDYNACLDWDTMWIRNNAFNIALDHATISWGADELLGVNAATGPEPQDLFIRNTLFAEALHDAGINEERPHSKGALFNLSVNGTATLIGNAFIHNRDRTPRISTGWRLALVNNLVYNVAGSLSRDGPWPLLSAAEPSTGTTPSGCFLAEWVHIGNKGIAGLDSTAGQKTMQVLGAHGGTEVYLEKNEGQSVTGATGNGQWAGMTIGGILTSTHTNCGGSGNTTLTEGHIRINTAPSWYTAFGITPSTATGNTLRDEILANVGARPSDRDSHDTRVIADVAAGTGNVIDSQEDIGGIGTLAANTRDISAAITALGTLSDDGACGSTSQGKARTVLECFLLNDATFGAVSVEP